jgi:hypothetical protein
MVGNPMLRALRALLLVAVATALAAPATALAAFA